MMKGFSHDLKQEDKRKFNAAIRHFRGLKFFMLKESDAYSHGKIYSKLPDYRPIEDKVAEILSA